MKITNDFGYTKAYCAMQKAKGRLAKVEAALTTLCDNAEKECEDDAEDLLKQTEKLELRAQRLLSKVQQIKTALIAEISPAFGLEDIRAAGAGWGPPTRIG